MKKFDELVESILNEAKEVTDKDLEEIKKKLSASTSEEETKAFMMPFFKKFGQEGMIKLADYLG